MLATERVFNDCVLGYALGHAAHIGLLDRLSDQGRVSLADFAEQIDAPQAVIHEVCANLAREGVVRIDGDSVLPGSAYKVGLENAGYFEWLLLGYGGLLASPEAIRCAAPQNTRNGRVVASGSARIGLFNVDPILLPYAESIASGSIVDLGCGSGQRLLALAERDPVLIATGVDIDRAAVALAQALVKEKGLEKRVSITCGDVSDLDQRFWQDIPQSAVMMSFMGHDMWPYDQACRVFSRFRVCFGGCGHFLMSDTVRPQGADSDDSIFTQGFCLTHAFMGKYIPRIDEWDKLFEATGWKLNDCVPLGVPSTYMFDLIPV